MTELKPCLALLYCSLVHEMEKVYKNKKIKKKVYRTLIWLVNITCV